jgi:hypothetical protein
VRGDGGWVMTEPPSRPEARSRFGPSAPLAGPDRDTPRPAMADIQ